jgi:hypothetical protein
MTKNLIRARGREDVDKCYEEFMNYEGAGE